ncbi:MAG: GspE/PulE family protein [Candidatus Omnitrophica bacterium]|nr:GspE/PulE family protein [Candidatus Omnitrophota bacterium]
MLSKDDIRIGQMLVDSGTVTPEQLAAGLKEQEKSGDFICATLVKMGFASEEKIFAVLSAQLSIPYVRLKDKDIDPALIQKVPAKFASHYKIMPIESGGNTLIVAMSDPLDVRTLDDISLFLEVEVKSVLASENEIKDAIRKYYGVGAETLDRIVSNKSYQRQDGGEAENIQDLETMAQDASIVKLVNQVMSEAIKGRATDIHLEPFQDELRTRFRIDGALYTVHMPETIKYFHPAIVSRIKIMAHLNIAERRLPQDGRLKVKVGSDELDLRVSILPNAFGEAVHIRILNPRSFLEMEMLGMQPDDLKIVEEVVKKPHGIIFVTGPTGSGKSTTLYASLGRINSPEVKIITVEDPIEYQMRGVNQMQVNPKIGFTFASGLRHILRHDPDIIMVGEVRDFETAEISIRASLTGHLVFSTLHTNDAAGAVTRLLDMGIESFLVSSSLECLIAQRLVRLICPHCRIPVSEDTKKIIMEQMKGLQADIQQARFFEGKGCESCRFTGYSGRTGIYEILRVTESVRKLILERASSQQIKKRAVFEGMRTLRADGLQKVLHGITTITEVMRVTQMEELA